MQQPPGAILPPASLGILGGGQLGRMLGQAARTLGYRVLVLDPDPDCPAAALADRVAVGSYSDVDTALRMARDCALVTYELEHVDLGLVEGLAARLPVRPGPTSLRVTQDRLAERRFLESAGAPVAPWREVPVGDDATLAVAARELGLPLRLKAARGGYDGRSQVRLASVADLAGAWEALGRPIGQAALAEAELDFEAELSVVSARSVDGGLVPFAPFANRHADGILVESMLPAPLPGPIAQEAVRLASRISEAMEMVGVLAVEMFLLEGGQLAVNELAPRVHNSGHATIEACAISQFEQHIRAICGLPLGDASVRSAAAMVNLLGTGPRRPARLLGVQRALSDPAVHLHLYDKREVHAQRKMGHLTVLAADADEALARARTAAAHLAWAEGPDDALASDR